MLSQQIGEERRKILAESSKEGLRGHMVLSTEAMITISKTLPMTLGQLSATPGVGLQRTRLYGERILAVIKSFVEYHNIDVPTPEQDNFDLSQVISPLTPSSRSRIGSTGGKGFKITYEGKGTRHPHLRNHQMAPTVSPHFAQPAGVPSRGQAQPPYRGPNSGSGRLPVSNVPWQSKRTSADVLAELSPIGDDDFDFELPVSYNTPARHNNGRKKQKTGYR